MVNWFNLSLVICVIEHSTQPSSRAAHPGTAICAEAAHLGEHGSVWTHSGWPHTGVGGAVAADACGVADSLDGFTLAGHC